MQGSRGLRFDCFATAQKKSKIDATEKVGITLRSFSRCSELRRSPRQPDSA